MIGPAAWGSIARAASVRAWLMEGHRFIMAPTTGRAGTTPRPPLHPVYRSPGGSCPTIVHATPPSGSGDAATRDEAGNALPAAAVTRGGSHGREVAFCPFRPFHPFLPFCPVCPSHEGRDIL